MAGSGRQDRDIARAQLDRAAMLAAEMDAGATARDPHHFMNARMIVKIVVNSVSPASRPAVAFKNIFEDSSRVKGSRQADGAPKDDKRPARMIGRLSVIPESEFADSSEADQFAELRLGGAFPAGHFLGRFLKSSRKNMTTPSVSAPMRIGFRPSGSGCIRKCHNGARTANVLSELIAKNE
jgi:hypothetical protein